VCSGVSNKTRSICWAVDAQDLYKTDRDYDRARRHTRKRDGKSVTEKGSERASERARVGWGEKGREGGREREWGGGWEGESKRERERMIHLECQVY